MGTLRTLQVPIPLVDTRLVSGADGSFMVRLVARNEGVEYRDRHGVYYFDVSRVAREWTVLLPGSKGENPVPHELTLEEERRILPRITGYLSRIKWFGVFPRSYSVRIRRGSTA